MDIHPGVAKFYPASTPFAHPASPAAPLRVNTSAVNWLLSRGFAVAPVTRYPLPPSRTDYYYADMSVATPYGHYMPAVVEEQRFRRRRQYHRTYSPTWMPSSELTSQQSVITTISNPQSTGKIVSIAYADPTGGSMIVTRRREDGHLDVRVVYSREFIVAASASPLALLPPANFRQMVLEMMEIIAKFPKSFYNSVRHEFESPLSE